jgi:hypothetical protein
MATKERVIQLIESLPDTPETERTLEVAEHLLEANGNIEPNGAEPKKVGRLPFFGIGEADPPDGAKRFDELLGIAIDKRHPRS